MPLEAIELTFQTGNRLRCFSKPCRQAGYLMETSACTNLCDHQMAAYCQCDQGDSRCHQVSQIGRKAVIFGQHKHADKSGAINDCNETV